MLAVTSAWLRFGRRIVSVTELFGGFGYALMKIPIYLTIPCCKAGPVGACEEG